MKNTQTEQRITAIKMRLVELENLSISGLTFKEEKEREELEKELDRLQANRGKYQRYKEQTREKAIFYQLDNRPQSWGEVAQVVAYLERQAKRYGLIKEFRNNGII